MPIEGSSRSMDKSIEGSKRRSVISDSKFVELEDSDGTSIYSTPQASPAIGSMAIDGSLGDHQLSIKKPSEQESGIEQKLDEVSPSDMAPSVPPHASEDDVHAHNQPDNLKSTIFQDRSTAEAIESAREHLAMQPKDGSRNLDANGEPVLLVRQGFHNFNGFGVKCVENEKDPKSSV